MLPKPQECNGCPLFQSGYGFIKPEGKNLKNVYLVGEAGGEWEGKEGKPFVKFAQAGSKLEEIFRLSGNVRDNFTIQNIVSCRPPGNKLEYMPYEETAITHCRQHFNKVIKPDGSNVILAMGNVALKSLTNYSGEKKESVSLLRGFILESPYGYVIPTYHPSFIKRGKPSFTPYLMYDLAKATKLSKNLDKGNNNVNQESQEFISNVRAEKLVNYNEAPSLDDLRSFYYKVKDSRQLILSYDIETPRSADLDEDEREGLEDTQIIQIQFSIEKGQAIAFPFSPEYMTVIKLLLLSENDKIGHNSYQFDNPRLRAKNLKINGTLHDSMFAFKQWNPGLLRNLQSVASVFNYPIPWKHLFLSQLRFYGCCDVDAPQYIFPRLKELMIKEGVWDGYIDHVVNFYPIMQAASDRGIPVNEDKRVKTKDYFTEERLSIDKEIQSLIPDELRPIGPKIKDKLTKEVIRTGYKHTPAVIGELWQRCLQDKQTNFTEYLKSQVFEVKDKDGKVKDRFIYKPVVSHYKNRWETTWVKQYFFKASSQQLIRYIEWKREQLENSEDRQDRKLARLYIVPTKYVKKGMPEKQTTGKDAMLDFLEKTYDDVIRLIIGDKDYESDSLMNKVGIRSIDTIINNYLKNWTPREDGKVHTQFGFIAASGQFDSRHPNILNCSKHTVTGQIFRGIIEAPKDYVFIEFDFKSFHVATMGYCAVDRDYIRFSQLDPHSFFTAQYINDSHLPKVDMGMSDSEIMHICNLYKKKYKLQRQHVSKVIVLGNQLGLGPRKIYLSNRKYFNSIRDAADKQGIINRLFGKVTKFKNSIREAAHVQHKLVNDWGYLQRFFEVYLWQYDHENKTLVRKSGSESEKAIAFPVQSTAFGKIRYDLHRLNDLGYLAKYNFINSIHDSVIFMPHKKLAEECLYNVRDILTAPCKRLINPATESTGGLQVNVEATIGRNWQNWDKDKNPEGMQEYEYTTSPTPMLKVG